MVALLLALFLLPHLFAGSLSVQEAESSVRDFYSRQITQAFLGKHKGDTARLDRDEAAELARNLKEVRELNFDSIKVRRGLLVPPLARRTAFLVEVKRKDLDAPQYFRINQGIAYETSSLWWHIPLSSFQFSVKNSY